MADIVTTRIFQDGEKNITAAKLNDIVASSTIQPAFVSSKPSTSTIATTDNLLVLQTAGTYAKAPFQTVIDSVSAGINSDAEIWKVRLRSFNAIGNPTFEVDQRNVGNTLAAVATNTLVQDRWSIQKAGTMVVSAGQQSVAAGINLPGTNFAISRSFFRVTLTTAEAALAAGDFLSVQQLIEGPRWRELQNDVHSLQVLVRSSVANLSIGLGLRDPGAANGLVGLVTIPTANTWNLLTLPNLVVWTPSGNFVDTPSNVGYQLSICLASGSTHTAPANGTWQSGGNFFGAVGQSNFAASPVNSTFDIAYISHEPGPLCSTPMDCPFTQNYDDCLRYYTKTFDYGTAVGTATTLGAVRFVMPANLDPSTLYIPFKKPMAKTPTITAYSPQTGAVNGVRDEVASGDRVVSSVQSASTTSFQGFNLTARNAAQWYGQFHYIADTLW